MAEMRREAAFDALAEQVGFGSKAHSRGLGANMLSDAPRRIAAVSRSIGIAAAADGGAQAARLLATDAPAQKPNETWNFPSQMSSPLWPKLR